MIMTLHFNSILKIDSVQKSSTGGKSRSKKAQLSYQDGDGDNSTSPCNTFQGLILTTDLSMQTFLD
ncbi:hypothetical protein EKG38_10855 [Shewanella canadensis]|uniref:Uncharacterized protein n=1 Tax=Shewanella canadensis TaxID=271096 RepID=A0A3S0LM44_9GAMM|nr:hypothetical protein [Shewanella canadensis]RTR38671.1 hypothetical protein EKG38_10855 [Shewanella canadensis]